MGHRWLASRTDVWSAPPHTDLVPYLSTNAALPEPAGRQD